jgi:hypothetical protein
MVISDFYDINKIMLDIEAALLIDGKDYSEKDVEDILENIRNRIIRQYQIDLHDKKINDDSLYSGKSRSQAVLFVENAAALHARLCGYLQIVRYNKIVTIRVSNINYMGFERKALQSFFMAAMGSSTMPSIETAISAIKRKFGSVNNCMEKKFILVMIVAYEFGLNELVAAISEILYLGDKL